MSRPTDFVSGRAGNGDPDTSDVEIEETAHEDVAEGDGRSVASFTAGLMLGVALGAGVALLLAPRPGDETRKLLGRRARRLGDRVADRVDDLRDDIRRSARKGEKRLRRSMKR
jgi:hypothetical protein